MKTIKRLQILVSWLLKVLDEGDPTEKLGFGLTRMKVFYVYFWFMYFNLLLVSLICLRMISFL